MIEAPNQLLLLVIAATAWVMYPLIQNNKEEYSKIVSLSETFSERYKIPEDKLQSELEKYGNYNFNHQGPQNWIRKDALLMTRITNKIFSTVIGCAHPDGGPGNPVTATITIEGTIIKELVFSKATPEQKNERSHRGVAVRALLAELNERGLLP